MIELFAVFHVNHILPHIKFYPFLPNWAIRGKPQQSLFYEFPSHLGSNKVSYCIRSLKLEFIFFGESEKRSVFVGCKSLMGLLT
jgi:hypothetical protein